MSGASDGKLDQVGKLLIRAAQYIETNTMHSVCEGHASIHPMRAIYLVGLQSGEDALYGRACKRLTTACGMDFIDHSPVENIADLVAAAFWEVPHGA